MTTNKKSAQDLIQEARREHQANLARGVGVFDGGKAWRELSKQMADAVLQKLEDDFDKP
ncbi:hypothetical protein [Pseudomonas sp. 43(2021)]|uniref:hypothetical protein n=1 Tax=Pseudomonas sp. 43(2021) TaxID=2813560 RepID=UPI001A9FC39D|nr:hypothetical protein [Pseudomonas sp. 43(2021)]